LRRSSSSISVRTTVPATCGQFRAPACFANLDAMTPTMMISVMVIAIDVAIKTRGFRSTSIR
jgi:hypothetical protein